MISFSQYGASNRSRKWLLCGYITIIFKVISINLVIMYIFFYKLKAVV